MCGLDAVLAADEAEHAVLAIADTVLAVNEAWDAVLAVADAVLAVADAVLAIITNCSSNSLMGPHRSGKSKFPKILQQQVAELKRKWRIYCCRSLFAAAFFSGKPSYCCREQ